MPIIATYEGDLVKSFLDVRDERITDMAHGANCFNTMGSGIAHSVAIHIHEAYAADQSTPRASKAKLGGLSVGYVHRAIRPQRDVFVVPRCFNLYTQYRPGRNVDYGAIRRAFSTVNKHYNRPGMILGIPLIGCGIAGGDWSIVSEIIEQTTPNLNVAVFHFKP